LGMRRFGIAVFNRVVSPPATKLEQIDAAFFELLADGAKHFGMSVT